ncbi:hypothetical protein KIN20_030413 [Parelaphostrongylus tenuis]|uniref:Uncharacterized protein n=1 Tax=Parelaphostrongylus tenuis TaxID=148309 RepID=A0AAD5WG42_PARTN|nr:hypothetical protein KIN20_030413 [Parelaphostrongylus tenuis]
MVSQKQILSYEHCYEEKTAVYTTQIEKQRFWFSFASHHKVGIISEANMLQVSAKKYRLFSNSIVAIKKFHVTAVVKSSRFRTMQSHTLIASKEEVSLIGLETLNRLPYLPDLSPSDFHLFTSLEHWLNQKRFETPIICIVN